MAGTNQSRRRGDIRAIFVHAGAGFHSIGNERLHLKACHDACKAAMAILKQGGTAVDAVEIAVKVLEDREITNAGYGSNLAVDGAVECDAIVVDNYGRSGAVGAVAQIKNPVSLARLILDRSSKPLLLRRVPPNLLCGEGATQWACEQGMEILPHDGLVSPAAQERWKKWVEDLEIARRRHGKHHGSTVPKPDLLTSDDARVMHRQNMLLPKGQKIFASPATTSEIPSHASSSSSPFTTSASSRTTPDVPNLSSRDKIQSKQASRNPMINSTQKVPTLYDVAGAFSMTGESSDSTGAVSDHEMDMADVDDNIPEDWIRHPPRCHTWHDESSGGSEDEDSSRSTLQLPSMTPSPPANTPVEPNSPKDEQMPDLSTDDSSGADEPRTNLLLEQPMPSSSPSAQISSSSKSEKVSTEPQSTRETPTQRTDLITDTVGAIAIDIYGNIAAAASSGGIGMKHQGRVGPAALVGVGASVLPVQENDPDRMCVATVTSGTGEHMATTLAAQTCSTRVYHSVKKVSPMSKLDFDSDETRASASHMPVKGLAIADHDDDAVRSFVELDFMSHPSVKHSISAGAIGVLTIKKTKDGAYMYFGHNTDSFALASQHADEPKPVVCMSRSPGNGSIAQGGRAIRPKHHR